MPFPFLLRHAGEETEVICFSGLLFAAVSDVLSSEHGLLTATVLTLHLCVILRCRELIAIPATAFLQIACSSITLSWQGLKFG
jgi:hypothetical protein